MTAAFVFIIQTLAQLYLLLYLLRFWLPLVRADFQNPIAQGILRFTSPLIIPVRRFIPPIGRIDTATVLVTFAMQCLIIFVIGKIVGVTYAVTAIAWLALLELCILSLNLFFFSIIISIIFRLFAPQSYNPITAIVGTISEPVLRPFRRLIPTVGSVDISPIFALVLLQAGVIWLQTLKPLFLR